MLNISVSLDQDRLFKATQRNSVSKTKNKQKNIKGRNERRNTGRKEAKTDRKKERKKERNKERNKERKHDTPLASTLSVSLSMLITTLCRAFFHRQVCSSTPFQHPIAMCTPSYSSYSCLHLSPILTEDLPQLRLAEGNVIDGVASPVPIYFLLVLEAESFRCTWWLQIATCLLACGNKEEESETRSLVTSTPLLWSLSFLHQYLTPEFLLIKNKSIGGWRDGSEVQRLRALTALPEVLRSIPSTHMVAHSHL